MTNLSGDSALAADLAQEKESPGAGRRVASEAELSQLDARFGGKVVRGAS